MQTPVDAKGQRVLMGLGSGRSEWDDFEWFELDAVDEIGSRDVWVDDASTRVFLCDLDNVRGGREQIESRMAVALALARSADVVAFAGQEVAVRGCRESLAEFAAGVTRVGSGRNVADNVLLDVAEALTRQVQFVVMSNDGIFARLAERGALTVVSPCVSRASRRLVAASRLLVDVGDLDVIDPTGPADEPRVAA